MEKVYYHGKILTMEASDAEREMAAMPEAVLVRDGLIAAVGQMCEIRKAARSDAEWKDLAGCCLMPSFIDSHSHFVMNGRLSLCADLSECESFEDIIHKLREYIWAKHITKEQAVLGFGYDHNFLKEQSHPVKRVLDQVSQEIPIMVMHISAHLACVNSVALALAGIDGSVPDPDGGRFGRMPGGNEPDGYVEEGAMMALQDMIGKRVQLDPAVMPDEMQRVYLKNGVTTVQDGASAISDIRTLDMLAEKNLLKLDVVAYPLMSAGGESLMEDFGAKYRDYHNHVKIGGYKLVLDGSPQARSAWMSEPYLGGEKDDCGYPWLADEAVEQYVLKAVEEKKQLLAHCNGDAASEQYLNAYEKAAAAVGNGEDLRPVMIHCQTVRNDQLERMARLRMIASVFVGHVWYWGDIHVKNLGSKRGNHISPVKDAIDRGVMVNFHQDTPVTKPNMLHSVWCAVNRISRKGKLIGETQRIPIYEALKAVTANGAYQYFEEGSKGSIKKGKRADLVILDRCPLETEPMELRDICVLETIKDGVTVYAN